VYIILSLHGPAYSRPASFNKADVLLVPKTQKTSPSGDNDDVDGSRCCHMSRCSRWIIVVVIIVVCLTFGVGFIAGWFGHASTSTAAAAVTANTTSASSTVAISPGEMNFRASINCRCSSELVTSVKLALIRCVKPAFIVLTGVSHRFRGMYRGRGHGRTHAGGDMGDHPVPSIRVLVG